MDAVFQQVFQKHKDKIILLVTGHTHFGAVRAYKTSNVVTGRRLSQEEREFIKFTLEIDLDNSER
jgi:hypothetical protein